MVTATFEDRAREIDDRIRELIPELWAKVERDTSRPDERIWRYGVFSATLIMHRTESYPRLSLELLTGEEDHPEALQIGFDEADVVDMIAHPIAGLLSGGTV